MTVHRPTIAFALLLNLATSGPAVASVGIRIPVRPKRLLVVLPLMLDRSAILLAGLGASFFLAACSSTQQAPATYSARSVRSAFAAEHLGLHAQPLAKLPGVIGAF